MSSLVMPSRIFIALVFLSATGFADDTQLLQETRAVAAAMPSRLMVVLQDEISRAGPVAAIAACRDKAPQIAREASAKTGWQIRRVSLKNRNPNAAPDEWERAALIEFDQRSEQGIDPATMEKAEIVSDGDNKIYRYMKALPTQALCLTCHGSDREIPTQVKAKLHELYPNDLATGYTVGSIRGAVTIKRPLP